MRPAPPSTPPPPVPDMAAEAVMPSPTAAIAVNATGRDMPPPAVMEGRDEGDDLPGGTQVDTTQVRRELFRARECVQF